MARYWIKRGGVMVPLGNQPATPPPPPIDKRPVARLTVTPVTGTAPLTVTANASASTDDHGIAGYTFNFDDGSATVSQSGATATHTYSAAGSYSVSVTATDTIGQASNPATAAVTVNAVTPPGTTPYQPGLSASNTGINAGDAAKQAAWLDRTATVASRVGVSAATIRGKLNYHWYHSGTPVWDAANLGGVSWAKNNGVGGVMVNMKLGDLNTWASGGFDANYKNTMLPSYAKIVGATGMRFVLVFEHEPENNKWTAAQADLWCQGTARFMKLTAEFNNPSIIFSTCHIPGSPGLPRSAWNARPHLNTLAGSSAAAQAIMDKCLCGLDPYPEVNQDGSLETLAGRCAAAMTDFKSWGWTRFSCPEVALYNWVEVKNTPGYNAGLTATQQATRLRNEIWVWLRNNGFETFNYYDVFDPANDRTVQRSLDTPEEQTMFGKIILGTA